ncbi:uncharacterized protein LOC119110075 [Pollicipes pollicipes]|uniref:uncharacterized protein LOC119110075 n=1 Tax=Pollicipes pollicipes TaxID=41117 RepID=UPI001884A667|nr:uncharacterized protein LOC119110075 [Pollicipes pollicipes]
MGFFENAVGGRTCGGPPSTRRAQLACRCASSGSPELGQATKLETVAGPLAAHGAPAELVLRKDSILRKGGSPVRGVMRPPPTVDMCPDLDTLAELGAADETVRIAVLGMQGVGKSAITVRYLTHRFIGEYKSNTDMMYHQVIKLDGSTIKVDIIDVSTSVQSGALVHNNIRSWAEGFLLVYAVTEPDSFEHARHLLEELRRTGAGLRTAPVRDGSKSPAGRRKRAATPQRPASGDTGEPTAPTILVGNKTDLIHLTKVDSTLALETALRLGCQREEVSASDSSEEISALFHTVIRQCLALKRRRSGMDALRSAFSSLPRAGRGQLPTHGETQLVDIVSPVELRPATAATAAAARDSEGSHQRRRERLLRRHLFTTSPLKTSVPDLSKASLSEKLDTLKKTVKKVSV